MSSSEPALAIGRASPAGLFGDRGPFPEFARRCPEWTRWRRDAVMTGLDGA
jgi:hypothetical protein